MVCVVCVLVFHCTSGLLQGSVVSFKIFLVPAVRSVVAQSLHSGHKWHMSPKFKMYLASLRSSRGPEVFPSCFDTGRMWIKSSPGCYLGPSYYISLLSGVKVKELIWKTRRIWQSLLKVESESAVIKGETRAIALQLNSTDVWGLWFHVDWTRLNGKTWLFSASGLRTIHRFDWKPDVITDFWLCMFLPIIHSVKIVFIMCK
jgi:hypothetical protein